MKILSIVVPCFNEALNLNKFYSIAIEQINAIKSQGNKIDYELVFVNDGSSDNTLEILNSLANNDNKVKILDFSRNFGKEAAILAGIKNCSGDLISLVDADLQHPLDLLPVMYQHLINMNVDIVYARRIGRSDSAKSLSYLKPFFYKIYGFITNLNLRNGVTDYSIMTREVADAILQLTEYHRFTKGIFEWVGFKKYEVEYPNIAREHGNSGWSLIKLFKYAMDGIFSFSAMPLRASFILGLVSSIFAIIYACYVLISTLIFGNVVKGYPSLICLISFFAGLQLIVMGVIGEYIARIYEQVKHRPHYILKDHSYNNDKNG